MNNRVISFQYTLTDSTGKKLDSSVGHEPLTYLEGKGQIIPGLEKQIQGLKLKDKKTVTIPAAEAYGLRDEKFVVEVPLEKLPSKNVKVGDQFQAGGELEGHPFLVTKITSTHATMDANHPLAGVDLTFDIEIVAVRQATEEEIGHGHVHGAGGHHH